MKKKLLLYGSLGFLILPGCSSLKSFEHDLSVTYIYNDNIIYTGTVNEFKNLVQPQLSDAQIPMEHEFYGWTWKDPNDINIKDEDFSSQYIAYDEVIHYADIKEHSFNSNVTLYPVFVNENDIPIPDYYIAIGWYAKTSTSGLSKEIMANWEKDLKTYLKSEGATDEDLANIVIKGYEGDVATAGSLVMKDRFIDVLLGFGKNMTSTGGIETKEMLGGIKMGGKDRYIARLSDKEIATKVYAWVQTDAGNHSLAG